MGHQTQTITHFSFPFLRAQFNHSDLSGSIYTLTYFAMPRLFISNYSITKVLIKFR